jgi:hypothetical protein
VDYSTIEPAGRQSGFTVLSDGHAISIKLKWSGLPSAAAMKVTQCENSLRAKTQAGRKPTMRQHVCGSMRAAAYMLPHPKRPYNEFRRPDYLVSWSPGCLIT